MCLPITSELVHADSPTNKRIYRRVAGCHVCALNWRTVRWTTMPRRQSRSGSRWAQDPPWKAYSRRLPGALRPPGIAE